VAAVAALVEHDAAKSAFSWALTASSTLSLAAFSAYYASAAAF